MIITLIATIIVLGVLILAHEFGHYAGAKLLGVRVLKFSVGLGPKLLGFKKNETEYMLSAVPFGGFVKLAGMEPDEIKGEEGEYEGKPMLSKILICLAGPLANLILGFIIYLVITGGIGIEVFPTTRIGRVEADSPAFAAGLKEKDRILMVDGENVSNWNEVIEKILGKAEDGVNLNLKRDGSEEIEIFLKPVYDEERGTYLLGIFPLIEPIVGGVIKGSPAERTGLKRGDRVTVIENKKVEKWEDMADIIRKNPAVPLHIEWKRNDEKFYATIIPIEESASTKEGKKEKIGIIGIQMYMAHKRFPPIEAIKVSCGKVLWLNKVIFVFLGKLITGRASARNLGGPILIAKLAGETARMGLGPLLNFIAFVSINLWIINIFPIPVLDGGHIMYSIVEGVRRKPLTKKEKQIAQQIGFVLIMALALFVVFNDIMRLMGQK